MFLRYQQILEAGVMYCIALYYTGYLIWNGHNHTYVRTSSSSVIAHPISPETNSIADDKKKTKNKKNENTNMRPLWNKHERYYSYNKW